MKFADQILKRIEKIDRNSLQSYVAETLKEKDFLAGVLDSVPQGIWIVQPDGKIEYANQSAKSVLGIGHSASLRNRRIQDVLQDRSLSEVVSGCLLNRRYVFQREIEMIFPRPAFLCLTVIPFTRGTGNEDSFLVVFEDTSNLRAEERRLAQSEKVESLISLARGVAHEIGNPLSAITIHLKLLEQEISSEKHPRRKNAEEILRVIAAETERLSHIIRNFLVATRRRTPEFRESDLNDILRDSVKVLKPEMEKNGIKAHLDLCQTLPPMLLDAEKLHQAFLNIFKNAIQSMPRGGTIHVASSKNGKICTVQIRDQGIGIPENVLPRIFEAYYTTKEEGSGLGLMIVHNIIKEHGGRIEVRSKEGKGTCFTLYLPIRSEKIPLPDPSEETQKP